MRILQNLKRLGKKLLVFTSADVVGPTSHGVVARTGNIRAALAIGSRMESRFPGRRHRSRFPYSPPVGGNSVSRRSHRRGGQRHDRSHGD